MTIKWWFSNAYGYYQIPKQHNWYIWFTPTSYWCWLNPLKTQAIFIILVALVIKRVQRVLPKLHAKRAISLVWKKKDMLHKVTNNFFTIFASLKDAWTHKIGKVTVGCIEFFFENISPSSVNMKKSLYLGSHTWSYIPIVFIHGLLLHEVPFFLI